VIQDHTEDPQTIEDELFLLLSFRHDVLIHTTSVVIIMYVH
jgi:hypothetical protein